MLELKYIRAHLKQVREMLRDRGYALDLSLFESVDQKRRELLPVLEGLRHKRNRASQDIAEMKKRKEDASTAISEMKEVSSKIKAMEAELAQLDSQLKPLLMVIPNMPHESVPQGSNEEDNDLVRTWGNIEEKGFKPLPHWEIGEKLGILDFECAAKIAGAIHEIAGGRPAAPSSRTICLPMLRPRSMSMNA